jgi:hypothetical protein
MTKYKLAALAATVAAITAISVGLTGAQASGGKTQILRIFDKPVATTLTDANGKVTSRPPYPQPSPGDVLDVYSLDFRGNHIHHSAHWSMSTHLRCRFVTGPPDCESHVAIGGSLLIFEGDKLTGGTGDYQGATGRVLSSKEIPGPAGTSDVVVRIRRR